VTRWFLLTSPELVILTTLLAAKGAPRPASARRTDDSSCVRRLDPSSRRRPFESDFSASLRRAETACLLLSVAPVAYGLFLLLDLGVARRCPEAQLTFGGLNDFFPTPDRLR